MKFPRLDAVGLATTALALLLAVVAYPRVPEPMVIHWGASGQPNGVSSRLFGLGLFPAFTAGLWLLFRYLPRIDPRGEAYAAFRGAYEAFVALLLGFLLFVEGAVVLWNLGYEYDVGLLLVPAIAAMYVAIGLLLGRAERNWFVGIRTPWTLSNDEVWKRTHCRAARGFVLAGLLCLGGLVLPEFFLAFVLVPVLLVTVDAVVYSFLDFRRVKDNS
jgi:uncharacterized membrane protein